MPSPSPKITREENHMIGISWPEELISRDTNDEISHKIESDITLENDGSDKENIPPFLGNKDCHCHTKWVDNGEITQKGRNKTRMPGDTYTGTAGSLTKAIWKGDRRPSTCKTTWKMSSCSKEKDLIIRNKSEYKRREKGLQ